MERTISIYKLFKATLWILFCISLPAQSFTNQGPKEKGKSGEWIRSKCGFIYTTKAATNGAASLVTHLPTEPENAAVSFCHNGREFCDENPDKFTPAKTIKLGEKEFIGEAFSIPDNFYTLVTLRVENDAESYDECNDTFRITRRAAQLEIEPVTDYAETLKTNDSEFAEPKKSGAKYTYQEIFDLLKNTTPDTNGDGVGDLYDIGSVRQPTYVNQNQNGYLVQVKTDSGYTCDHISRNALRFLTKQGVNCEVHWYYILDALKGNILHAQLLVETSSGWVYLEPQLNKRPGWLPSPTSATEIQLRFKIKDGNYEILSNPKNMTVDLTY